MTTQQAAQEIRHRSMKNLLFILISVLSFSNVASGMTDAEARSISPEEFRALLPEFEERHTARGFVDAAFSVKRMDLIKECFQQHFCGYEVVLRFSKVPSGDFKNQLALALLRAPWAYDEPKFYGNRGSVTIDLGILETMAPHFPPGFIDLENPIPSKRLFDSLKERETVAEVFEERLAGAEFEGVFTEVVAKRLEEAQSARNPVLEAPAVVATAETALPPPPAEAKSNEADGGIKEGLWIVGVFLAAACLAGIFIWRRWKSRQS